MPSPYDKIKHEAEQLAVLCVSSGEMTDFYEDDLCPRPNEDAECPVKKRPCWKIRPRDWMPILIKEAEDAKEAGNG
jgi:hypothetical protein